MAKILRELTNEEFTELSPMLSQGAGGVACPENLEILDIMNEAKTNAKFFLKRKNYPLKNPTGLQYLVHSSRVRQDYPFRVSIRSMKDKSGWVLLRLSEVKK